MRVGFVVFAEWTLFQVQLLIFFRDKCQFVRKILVIESFEKVFARTHDSQVVDSMEIKCVGVLKLMFSLFETPGVDALTVVGDEIICWVLLVDFVLL